MADYKHIIPFIRKAEGGYVNDPLDAGGETNCGVTYNTWCSIFGNDSHNKFIAMADEDWSHIFKTLYWDKMLGDQIKSQRIADIIVDWVWGSGSHYAEADVQDILIHAFSQHLTEDGVFGAATINAINTVDEEALYKDIIAKRFWFFDQCVLSHPTNQRFIKGWQNRLNNLVQFENAGHI
jgi:lysozyme family protein